jgi:hypothetical protein
MAPNYYIAAIFQTISLCPGLQWISSNPGAGISALWIISLLKKQENNP